MGNDIRHNEMSEDQLYVEIGKALVMDETGFLPTNLKGLEERGRRWVKARLDVLEAAICSSPHVKTAVADGTPANLIAAIAGAIEGSVTGSAVSPIAVILFRHGINSLCKDEWATPA